LLVNSTFLPFYRNYFTKITLPGISKIKKYIVSLLLLSLTLFPTITPKQKAKILKSYEDVMVQYAEKKKKLAADFAENAEEEKKREKEFQDYLSSFSFPVFSTSSARLCEKKIIFTQRHKDTEKFKNFFNLCDLLRRCHLGIYSLRVRVFTEPTE